MTVLDDVLGSVHHMTLGQLLLAFVACTCYATLQSPLFFASVRMGAATGAALSAAGFVLSGDEWVHGVMLLAFGVVALGTLNAAVWLLGHLLGFDGQRAPRVFDSTFADSVQADMPGATGLANRPAASAQLAAQSR